MANPQFAITPSQYPSISPLSFNVNNGTLARVLLEPFAAVAESATTPRYYGGAAVIDLVASSTDAANKDFILWQGTIVTTQDAVATGNIALTATTITRLAGSWITDGWNIGDVVGLFGAPNVAAVAGAEGVLGVVSAISATVLTFSVVGGNAWSVTNAGLGSRFCKMHQKFRTTVPLNAGNTAAIPSFSILNNVNDGSLLRTELHCGMTDILALQSVAALSALPAAVSFKIQAVRY